MHERLQGGTLGNGILPVMAFPTGMSGSGLVSAASSISNTTVHFRPRERLRDTQPHALQASIILLHDQSQAIQPSPSNLEGGLTVLLGASHTQFERCFFSHDIRS